MVVIGKNRFFPDKVVVFGRRAVLFGQGCCVGAKSDCVHAKKVELRQSGCICAEVVIFLQS